jgi:hypothetical protein
MFPPRVRQAGDEPLRNRIRGAPHHDRERARGVLGSADRGDAPCDNHVHLEPDQLGRQVAEPLETPLRIAVLNDEVLALDITEVAQTLPKGLQSRIGIDGMAALESTDPVHFRRLLCLGCERRYEHTQGERDDAPDGATPHGHLLQSAPC